MYVSLLTYFLIVFQVKSNRLTSTHTHTHTHTPTHAHTLIHTTHTHTHTTHTQHTQQTHTHTTHTPTTHIRTHTHTHNTHTTHTHTHTHTNNTHTHTHSYTQHTHQQHTHTHTHVACVSDVQLQVLQDGGVQIKVALATVIPGPFGLVLSYTPPSQSFGSYVTQVSDLSFADVQEVTFKIPQQKLPTMFNSFSVKVALLTRGVQGDSSNDSNVVSKSSLNCVNDS